MKHDEPNNPRSRDAGATMSCERVLELVPTFVDGEASESLSGSVRKHLIDCAECRVVVQEAKSLRQWFEPIAGEAGRVDVEIPEGFASRVAALAFDGSTSGSTGGGSDAAGSAIHLGGSQDRQQRQPHQQRRGPRLLRSLDAGSSQAGSSPADSLGGSASAERSSFGFAISMTAVAAALMVSFTLMLAQDKRQDVGGATLSADSKSLEETLRDLEAANELEIEALEQAATKDEVLDRAADGAPGKDSK